MLRCVPSSPPKSAIVVELGQPFSRQAEKAEKTGQLVGSIG